MRSRVATRLLPLVALGAGCSPDFSAALHVTFTGETADSGGGYWVDLRRPDGGAVAGLERRFVSFKPGTQDVALVVDAADAFQGSDAFEARLFAGAVPSEEADPFSRGSLRVTLERDQVVEVELELLGDPRPLAAGLVTTYALGSDQPGDERLDIDASDLPEIPFLFDLWLEDATGRRVWVDRLDAGGTQLDLEAQREVIGGGLTLVVTGEPIDSPEPLARSSGWDLARGAMHPAAFETLVAAPAAERGWLAAMRALVDVAEQHAGFALDAFDEPNTENLETHAEHVWSTIAGEALAETIPAGETYQAGDLDHDGSASYTGSDRTGLGHGDRSAAPGYLHRVDEASSTLESAGVDIGPIQTCSGNLQAAIDGALARAESLVQLSSDPVAANSFDCAVWKLRGDSSATPRDAATCTITDVTLDCIERELAVVAGFDLAPLP